LADWPQRLRWKTSIEQEAYFFSFSDLSFRTYFSYDFIERGDRNESFFCEFLRPGVEQTAPARGLRISFRSFGPREGAGPAAQYIDSHAGASSDVDARVTCPPGGVSKWKRGFRAVPGRNRRDGADFLKATLNFSAVGCTWLSTCTPLAPVGPFLAPNGGWLR